MLDTRHGIEDGNGVARPIDEQLLARHMRLPHRWRNTFLPIAIAFAEPAVSVTLAVLEPVFLPEQRHRDAAPLHLGVDDGQLRLGAGQRLGRIRRRKQTALKVRVIKPFGQWPAEPGSPPRCT